MRLRRLSGVKKTHMENKMNAIYTITVLHLSGERRQRTWGWFSDFDTAEKAVLTNATDMFEMGYYDHAVIEEMPEGLLVVPEKEWFYLAVYKDGIPNISRIDKPELLENTCCFSMG